ILFQTSKHCFAAAQQGDSLQHAEEPVGNHELPLRCVDAKDKAGRTRGCYARQQRARCGSSQATIVALPTELSHECRNRNVGRSCYGIRICDVHREVRSEHSGTRSRAGLSKAARTWRDSYDRGKTFLASITAVQEWSKGCIGLVGAPR